MNGMSVPEKLSINKYELDETAHISIDKKFCQEQCTNQVCLFICPAQVYSKVNEVIAIDHAGCLECGTCLVACAENALRWHYPNGGYGIIYRNG